jgi:hypothetical protein
MTEPVAGGAMALAKAVQSSGRRPSRDPRTTRPQRETYFGFRQLIRGLPPVSFYRYNCSHYEPW